MTRTDKIHFGSMINGIGGNTDGWRHPEVDATASTNFDYYKNRAQLAEKALFDFVFIADGLSISEKSIPHFLNRFEPITVLSALASVTNKIGLVGTFSTTFTEPFTLARQLASLDQLSEGRAGWNVVTSPQAGAAKNHHIFKELPAHSQRYEIAQEHLDVVRGLWHSWEDDAFTRDKETGEYYDPEKFHALNHQGKYYEVAGPLNIGRSKQGEPVVFQAGASDTGRDFAAKNADAIFAIGTDFEKAQAFYRDVKARREALSQDSQQLKIFPGISTVIGATKEEAEAKYQEYASLIPIDHALTYLGRYYDDYDLTQFDLDAPFPDLSEVGKNGFQSSTAEVQKDAEKRGLTLRQVAIEQAFRRPQFLGTAEEVADLLQEWFEGEAADGFILVAEIPGSFEDFTEQVIPILQDRGLYRTEYPAETLRGNIGIEKAN